jgi:hypothetical protein
MVREETKEEEWPMVRMGGTTGTGGPENVRHSEQASGEQNQERSSQGPQAQKG